MHYMKIRKQKKVRTAKDLFIKNSPYKPRIVNSKRIYNRKSKYKNLSNVLTDY